MKSFKSITEIFTRAQMKKAIGIARKSKGQYTKAYNEIEKIKKGLGDEHIIANALKKANEDTVDEARKIAVKDFRQVIKIAIKHTNNMQQAIKDIEKVRKGLSNHPDVMDILKKANEDIAEAVNLKALQKKFDRNEDQNRHTENYLLLAKTFGTPKEVKAVEKIMKASDKRKYLSVEDSRWLYDNLSKYFRKVYPTGKRESVDEGTWYIAKNMTKLKKAMKKPLHNFNLVAKHIGDDELWDDLEDLKKGQDMVPAIKKAMKRLNIKEFKDPNAPTAKEKETLFYKLFGMSKKEWDMEVKRAVAKAKKRAKEKNIQSFAQSLSEVQEEFEITENMANISKALLTLSKKPEYKKISKNLVSLSKRAKENDKKAPKQLAMQLAKLSDKMPKKKEKLHLFKMSNLAKTYAESLDIIEVKQIRWQDILKHKGNIKLGKTDTQGNWYGASTSDEKEIARLKKDGYKVMKENLDLEETTYSKIVLRGKNTKDEKKIKGLAKKAKVEVVNVKKDWDGLHMIFTHKSNKTLEEFTSQLKDFGSVHFGGPEKTYKPYMEAKTIKLGGKDVTKAMFIKDLERDKAKLFVKAMKLVANSPKQMKVRKELDKVWDTLATVQSESLEEYMSEAATFDDKQIARLKKEYDKVKTIDVGSSKYKTLRKFIDTMPKEQLVQLKDAGIKFISILAANTLRFKFNFKESYELVCGTPMAFTEGVDVDCRLLGFRAAMRRKEGEQQKGKVLVDRRTKGAKEAHKRTEHRKKLRDAKKHQSELDEIISKTNKSLSGQNEDMSIGFSDKTGTVDLTPHKKGLDGKSPVNKKKLKKKFKDFVTGRQVGAMVP